MGDQQIAWCTLVGTWLFGVVFGYVWRLTTVEDMVRRDERRERKQRIRMNALQLWDRWREGSP